MSSVDWTLHYCCCRGQWITLGIIAGWTLVAIVLWHCRIFGVHILLQFKLLTTFLHEFSHASAAWITGGKVKGIEVYTNEGGVTHTVGGIRWIILPAGYLGSCFWGLVFTLLASINIWTLRVGAGLLCFMLLMVLLFFARNWTVGIVCVIFILEIIVVWAFTELYHTIWPLRVAMLAIGSMNSVYSLLDILDDTIRRKEPDSDAYKCASLTHCSSRLCGSLWGLIALAFVVFEVYLLLAVREVGDETF
ncbi:uncharacterized protein LOC113146524 [Cyclospora cayetanensis]|uniref:Uncharacterized protein LOC113146524 n=1 Tax=Cyclospora cayetanensis TaxID=88456 RepID=A0A6P6RS01_9EIME|nr:uncharacterized protein LOC113146524 [Cyclospora cayetanensis]